MRDIETIETELMEISAIPDDLLKLERIIAWCASHPDEVPFALHQLLGRHDKHFFRASSPSSEKKSLEDRVRLLGHVGTLFEGE
jgi:hypothetical protein